MDSTAEAVSLDAGSDGATVAAVCADTKVCPSVDW